MKRVSLFLLALMALCSGRALAMGEKGDWIGSGAFGFTLGPGLVLVAPQLEYVYEPDLNFGALVNMGFGGDGLLVTFTGTVRKLFGDERSKWRPVAQGGIGMAMSSGLYNSSVGVHLTLGGGVDYYFDKTTAIGTMLNFNFAPPLKGMFLSWPLIIGRFRL